MTSPEFAAAQQRIIARRQERAAETQSRLESQGAHQAANRLSQLPGPFGDLGRRGVQTWDIVKGRRGTRPAFRVGQVDAELLDNELLSLLKGQAGEALKYFGVRAALGPGYENITLTIGSLISARTGHRKYRWGYEPFYSNSRSGTKMRPTAQHFKGSSTRMQGVPTKSFNRHQNGKRACMGCSLWLVAMAGRNGRTG